MEHGVHVQTADWGVEEKDGVKGERCLVLMGVDFT